MEGWTSSPPRTAPYVGPVLFADEEHVEAPSSGGAILS